MSKSELPQAFRVGEMVTLQPHLDPRAGSIPAFVVTANDDELHLACRVTAGTALDPGTILRVALSSRGRRHTSRAQILGVEPGGHPIVIARILPARVEAMSEVRAHRRVLTRLREATLSAVTGERAFGCRVRVVDLSTGGARVTGRRALATNTRVRLHFRVPVGMDADDMMELQGVVAWSRPARSLWQAGVRFVDNPELVMRRLTQVVIRVEDDLSRMA
jgi:hypothetical protein